MGRIEIDPITKEPVYLTEWKGTDYKEREEPWYILLTKYIAMVILMFIFAAGIYHIFVES